MRPDAEIVDDDLRALGGERQRIFAPQASPRARHHDDASLADACHLQILRAVR